VQLRGPVRYRFRSPEDDIDVVVEGDAAWVAGIRATLGLEDDRLGWSMPLGVTMTSAARADGSIGAIDDAGISSQAAPRLPGPPPDPSLIPAVVRTIGGLDLTDQFADFDVPTSPVVDVSALERMLETVAVPEPLENGATKDPQTEAWLQLLLKAVVRKHGVTELEADSILDLLAGRVAEDRVELQEFLDRLWVLGRLEKVLSPGSISYSPAPHWLEAK